MKTQRINPFDIAEFAMFWVILIFILLLISDPFVNCSAVKALEKNALEVSMNFDETNNMMRIPDASHVHIVSNLDNGDGVMLSTVIKDGIVLDYSFGQYKVWTENGEEYFPETEVILAI